MDQNPIMTLNHKNKGDSLGQEKEYGNLPTL